MPRLPRIATPDLTLVKTIEICSTREAATLHMKALKREEITKVKGMVKPKKHAKHRDQTKSKPLQSENLRTVTKKCHFCTQVHVMKKESCPAGGRRVRRVVERITYFPQENAKAEMFML